MNMTALIRQVGSATILDIRGRIVLGEETATLRVMLNDLLSKGHDKVLFNLGEVDYIDTAGLGFLISALAGVRKQGGELKLLKLTKKIQDVMQITKLYTVFDIFDNEETAVKAFGQSAAAKT